MKLEPLGERILVKLIEEEAVTASGLVLPETAKEKPQKGEVVAVSQDEMAEINVEVGDVVLFAKYSGVEIKLEGAEHLLLEMSDVIAKVLA